MRIYPNIRFIFKSLPAVSKKFNTAKLKKNRIIDSWSTKTSRYFRLLKKIIRAENARMFYQLRLFLLISPRTLPIQPHMPFSAVDTEYHTSYPRTLSNHTPCGPIEKITHVERKTSFVSAGARWCFQAGEYSEAIRAVMSRPERNSCPPRPRCCLLKNIPTRISGVGFIKQTPTADVGLLRRLKRF